MLYLVEAFLNSYFLRVRCIESNFEWTTFSISASSYTAAVPRVIEKVKKK